MSKFVDKDTSYKEKVAYAKEASKTVATIYGGYKVGTSIYNKITSPSSFGTMSKTDASGYQNYWNQVKQGVSVEQRYKLQKFGTLDTVNTIGNLKTYHNNTVSHSLIKNSLYDGQTVSLKKSVIADVNSIINVEDLKYSKTI